MIKWLKGLFGSLDRQEVAFERAAKASEDIADDLEAIRDQLRQRLRGEQPKQLEAATEEAETPKKGNRR